MNSNFHRYLLMLNALPRFPQKTSCDRIGKILSGSGYNVSTRTIQRDLGTLATKFPIGSDGAKPQGWFWDRNAVPLALSPHNPHSALVLQLAKAYLERLLPQASLDELAPFFKQSADTLDHFGNQLKNWPDKIRVIHKGPPLSPPVISPSIQQAIYSAVLHDNQLRIAYPGWKNTMTVNPLGLVLRERVSYLIAAFEGFEGVRQLALHRIRSAELLESSSKIPVDFDLDAFIASGEMHQPVGEKIALSFLIWAPLSRQLEETPLAEDQRIQDSEHENFKRVSATVQDTLELRWWLQAFGDDIAVEGPAELVLHFASLAKNLYQTYCE